MGRAKVSNGKRMKMGSHNYINQLNERITKYIRK